MYPPICFYTKSKETLNLQEELLTQFSLEIISKDHYTDIIWGPILKLHITYRSAAKSLICHKWKFTKTFQGPKKGYSIKKVKKKQMFSPNIPFQLAL